MDAVLYTESVRVESKVFYIDLKQNNHGRYVKLSELTPAKPRATILVPVPCLSWFVKLLKYFVQPGTGSLVDKRLSIRSKVFVFSIGENQKGRYLRITETSTRHPAGHSTVIIPAAGDDALGWTTLKDSIQRVCAIAQVPPLDEDEEALVASSSTSVGPQAVSWRAALTSTPDGMPVLSVGPKRWFFEVVRDGKGRQLQITEVLHQERSMLVVPSSGLSLFQDALARCIVGLRSRPTCAGDFLQEWTHNCLTQQDKYAFLKLVGASGLAALFREDLTGELLGDILVVLDACWMTAAADGDAGDAGLPSEALFVAQTMHALTCGFPSLVHQLSASSHRAAMSVLEAMRTCWQQQQQQQQQQHCQQQQQEQQLQGEQDQQPHCDHPISTTAEYGASAPSHGDDHNASSSRDVGSVRTSSSSGASHSAASGPGLTGRPQDYSAASSISNAIPSATSSPGLTDSPQDPAAGNWSHDVLWAHLWHVYVIAPRTGPRPWGLA